MKWDLRTRLVAFALSSSSIGGLVLHFYNLASLHTFVPLVIVPCFLALALFAFWKTDGRLNELSRMVRIGVVAGFVACLAYDAFRIPFVVMRAVGVQSPLALPLFKVFPRFGALILGQQLEQASYSLAAHTIGWAYHFSNGVGFGIMYVALIGMPHQKHWAWAALFALVLEAAMLFMPYPQLFSIRLTPTFVGVTLMAHLVFGVVMGLSARFLSLQSQRNGS